MKLSTIAAPLTVCAVILLTGADRAAAQRGTGGGRGPVHYDVAAEATVAGTVEEVRQTTGQGPGAGTHVIVKTASGPIELALGPSRYMTEKKYVLAKGDQVEAIGAKSTVDGREVVVVRQVTRGAETMTFRDAKGFPMWSGRGGR